MILGLSGSPFIATRAGLATLPETWFHDAAAALVHQGTVLAAVEEERTSRIKHANAFPGGAIRACMAEAGVAPADIDRFAFCFEEAGTDRTLREAFGGSVPRARELLCAALASVPGMACRPEQVAFVAHHDAHCAAAVAAAPFDTCLSVVVDGLGDAESTTLYAVHGGVRTRLRSYPVESSLGYFYALATRLLGFGGFDEYKVMGLAPLGDRARLRAEFAALARFDADGGFTLDGNGLTAIARRIGLPPRREGETIGPLHRDFAAAVQELLEAIVGRLLGHWREKTGLHRLCLSGGVAQNCVMNGVIARAGLFDAIYVHPAAHDAGAAIGAALAAEQPAGGAVARRRFSPLAGARIRREEALEALQPWCGVLRWERSDDVHGCLAQELADGRIAAIARGPAEFGPRALGCRSIVADPRPAGNRDRINAAIKKREDFRPFAPASSAARAAEYFELPRAACNLGEMCFVVPVRPGWQQRLGAVTHVDGTARLQVVDERDNRPFWSLVEAFGRLTGVAVLLNTSFNNRWEPIVNSAADAVRTFLVTDLDLLLLDDWIVRRTGTAAAVLSRAAVAPAPGARVEVAGSGSQASAIVSRHAVSHRVSGPLGSLLRQGQAHGPVPVAAFAAAGDAAGSVPAAELLELWERGLLDVVPLQA